MPIFLIIAAFLAATPALAGAQSGVTAGAYPACISEAKFMQAVDALKTNDEEAFRNIGGCVITKPGLKLNVLNAGKTVSKVQLFNPAGNAMEVWTDSKNISRAGAAPRKGQR